MRKFLFFLLCLPFFASAQNGVLNIPSPPLAAKAWILIESGSGQTLAAQAADERVEPASLTKLMTAYITFSALRQKILTLDQVVPVSDIAWKAQGSRMFIEPRKPVTVEELIQGMIVQSGNDACIALAEAIAGSEAAFVELMNREAKRLGMTGSQFRNPTGLPDPEHYATARDLALLAGALIRDFPAEYARYYSQKEYRYNNITQPNRNRLLWVDSSVDGVKTGFTDAAGYCLIASARRGPRRLLSVVVGTASDSARAQESLKLLNWGFQSFDALRLYQKGQPVSRLKVWKGADSEVHAGFPAADFILAIPKGRADQLKVELVSRQPLMAPVQAGQHVGTLRVTLAGEAYGEYPAYALKAVPVAGFFGRLFDSVRLWFM